MKTLSMNNLKGFLSKDISIKNLILFLCPLKLRDTIMAIYWGKCNKKQWFGYIGFNIFQLFCKNLFVRLQ